MKGFTSEKELATPSGFEPELSGPKPLVLRLHNGVAENLAYYKPFLSIFQPEKKNYSVFASGFMTNL